MIYRLILHCDYLFLKLVIKKNIIYKLIIGLTPPPLKISIMYWLKHLIILILKKLSELTLLKYEEPNYCNTSFCVRQIFVLFSYSISSHKKAKHKCCKKERKKLEEKKWFYTCKYKRVQPVSPRALSLVGKTSDRK